MVIISASRGVVQYFCAGQQRYWFGLGRGYMPKFPRNTGVLRQNGLYYSPTSNLQPGRPRVVSLLGAGTNSNRQPHKLVSKRCLWVQVYQSDGVVRKRNDDKEVIVVSWREQL